MRNLILRFSVGGFIIAALLVYLILGGTQRSAVYYVTVGEFRSDTLDIGEREVRIAGTVAHGSIINIPKELTLKFEIEDSTGSMPVMYRGTAPDLFKEGGSVVLEGSFEDGTFRATKILTKCPSKYEPREED
jgi:cytochrome c-type biogenesis protein CcmE